METILTENGIKEIEAKQLGVDRVVDVPSSKQEVSSEPEQKKQEIVPSQRTETKREAIREFNENPRTKQYGAKLIDKKLYIFLCIVAGAFILLFAVNMVWGNMLLSKFSEKDFGITVNPSDVNVTDADVNNIFNNYTIVNNISLPSNLTVNCRFTNST